MLKTILALLGVAVFAFLSGCGSQTKAPPPPGDSTKTDDPAAPTAEREHGSGGHKHVAPHGGVVNSVSDFHVELTVDVAAAKIVAYILDESGAKPKPIDAQTIALQAKSEGAQTFSGLSLSATPLDGEKSGNASRFEAPAGELVKAKSFEALLRIPSGGKVFRTAFQITPGRPVVQVRSYICPMNCEKGKVYPEPVPCPECGIKMDAHCPVCKMKLVEFKDGKVEHADHSPKHNGTFFMAADSWHHLEGVLVSPAEFRVYLYDNFTKPISANGYEGTAEVVRQDANGDDIGSPIVLPLKSQSDGQYLQTAIPPKYTVPLFFTVRIVLNKNERPALFNFSFERITGPSK